MIDVSTDMPTDPERALNHTLQHLATQPVPHGLEQRLLDRLVAAQDLPPAAVRPPWTAALRRALLPATLTLTAALVLVVVHHPHQTVSPVHHTLALQSSPPVQTKIPAPITANTHAPHHTQVPAIAKPDIDTALALAESNAPSQLAPELPLTADERALQHLGQHPNTDALGALNPARNAAEEIAEQVAFEKFFAHPVIPEALLKGERN